MKSPDDTVTAIQEFLGSYCTTPVTEDTLKLISNTYHKFEAAIYDETQCSVRDSATAWTGALRQLERLTESKLRILDFGAGTGYAALQLLNSPLRSKIQEIVLVEPSAEMLAVCRKKTSGFPGVKFTYIESFTTPDIETQARFDIVITNAVLHHVVDVASLLSNLGGLVKPGGFYLAGHEPNRNFYRNAPLVRETKRFQRYKKWRTRISVQYLMRKLGWSEKQADLISLVNSELLGKGIIKKELPRLHLHKLVDVHVPFGLDAPQPWGFVGFDPDELTTWLGSDFEAIGHLSYSHIKDGLAARDRFWKSKVQALQSTYPGDGADFLMIFRRKHAHRLPN